MMLVFPGGPECLSLENIKHINQALIDDDSIALCFTVVTTPLPESYEEVRARVLRKLRLTLQAGGVPRYIPSCKRIDDADPDRWGLWVYLKCSGLCLSLNTGPTKLSPYNMNRIARALKAKKQVILFFLIKLHGDQFPWDDVSTVLAEKLRAAGITAYSIWFSPPLRKLSNNRQKVRVTIRSKLLELPPH